MFIHNKNFRQGQKLSKKRYQKFPDKKLTKKDIKCVIEKPTKKDNNNFWTTENLQKKDKIPQKYCKSDNLSTPQEQQLC